MANQHTRGVRGAGPTGRRGLLRVAAAGMAAVAGGAVVGGVGRQGEAAPAPAATFGNVVTGNGPFGLRIVNNATAAGASGLRAEMAGAPGTDAAAVRGMVGGANASSYGVLGLHNGKGAGVRGVAPNGYAGVHGVSKAGRGVYGETTTGDAGVFGVTRKADSSGVRGQADGENAAGVFGLNATGAGVWGRTLGEASGVYGESPLRGVYGQGRGPDGSGVLGTSEERDGVVGATSAKDGSGVRGEAFGSGAAGVFGKNGSGPGVWGKASAGNGVRGESAQGIGVKGTTTSGFAGVYGESQSANNYGVYGWNSDGAGVRGHSPGDTGVLGTSTWGDGVTGDTPNVNGSGVRGQARGANAAGVFGTNTLGAGVWGRTTSDGASGVYGESPFRGVYGTGLKGVWGHTTGATNQHIGILGTAASATAWAGYFEGHVRITGVLTGATVANVIDHPLDPANKYLNHAAVGSPEMKNVYDGVVTTGADGRGVITLPAYVEALNRTFRYQLTAIGSPAHAYVSREISDGRFEITTDTPSVKVSWQVTGVRRDAYATRHGLVVEEAKTGADRGRYMHPEEHGQPASMAISPHQTAAGVETTGPVAPERLAGPAGAAAE